MHVKSFRNAIFLALSCWLTAGSMAQAIQTNTVLPLVTVSASVEYSWAFIWTGQGLPPARIYAQMKLDERLQEALKSADVCKAAHSDAARSTTAKTDLTNRWLAAQEVFNNLATSGLLVKYLENTTGLSFVLEGVKYDGFQVTYMDGSTERWPINPNWKFTIVKLLDTPLPESLKTPAKPRTAC